MPSGPAANGGGAKAPLLSSAEEWRPVVGFEGKYAVSSLGRVKSMRSGKILRPGLASNGYYTVALGKKSKTLHSLVTEAFLGPRPQGQWVRHLDGDRSRSVLPNLAYGTPQENAADTLIHGRRPQGEAYASAKLTNESARRIRALKGVVSQSVLAARYGVSPACVQAVHDGRTWKHV